MLDNNNDKMWPLLFSSFVWESLGSRTDLGVHEAWKLEARFFSHGRLKSNLLNHTGWHRCSGTVQPLLASYKTLLHPLGFIWSLWLLRNSGQALKIVRFLNYLKKLETLTPNGRVSYQTYRLYPLCEPLFKGFGMEPHVKTIEEQVFL